MAKRELGWLAVQARRAKRTVEVGCWLGRSTKWLANNTRGTVWAVDHWLGTPHDERQHTLYAETLAVRDPYAEFRVNLAKEITLGKVVPVRMESTKAAARLLQKLGPGSVQFVFIDADHSYEGCAADIRAFRPLVAKQGTLAGHDYHWPGVAKAVDEAFGGKATLGPQSIWSIRV